MRTAENKYRAKYYTNNSIREKIDKILERCASIYTNLGTNTSLDLKTKERAKKTEEKWLKEIKEIDPQFYEKVKLVK